MGWKEMSFAKKGLLIGIIVGLLFGFYSNITDCHTSWGGPSGCNNSFELYIAGFEFLLWLIPYALFGSLIPDTTAAFRVLLFISPIIFFGVIGLLGGWITGKIKSKKENQ
jgi:uncharacterized membrane protein YeaQ/YmgE (transglycosylase-associated protein family)